MFHLVVHLVILLLYCLLGDTYDHFEFTNDFQFRNDPTKHDILTNLLEVKETGKVYMPWGKSLQYIPTVTSDCLNRTFVNLITMDQFRTDGYRVIEKRQWIHAIYPGYFKKSCWAMVANIFGEKHSSEGPQDGVLQYLFHHIGVTNKYFVEFGWVKNAGANTYNLQTKHGFTGLLMDGGDHTIRDSPFIKKEFITPQNVIQLFQKYNVPLEPDYLSVDIDSADAWVLRAILAGKYRPRIISAEYNINFPIDSTITCDETCPVPWMSCRLFGSSFGALNLIGQEFGYSVVAVVYRFDVFFVRNDLLQNTEIPPISIFKANIGHPYLHPCTVKYKEENFGAEFVAAHAVDYAG